MTWEERLEVAKRLNHHPPAVLDATIGHLFSKLDIIDNESELNIEKKDDIYIVKRHIWIYSLNNSQDY